MELLFSLLVGVLFSVGFYLLLQKSFMRLILALLILTNAANLLLFVAGGLWSRKAPIIADGDTVLSMGVSDPLPQALILTAIVIGLGVTAYFLVLAKELYKTANTELLIDLRSTDL